MLPPIRIVFIDDSAVDNKYVSLLIKIQKLPLDPVFQSTVPKALEYLENCTGENFPQVILADINMPLYSGFDFADIYHQRFAALHPATHLFITSASVRLAERQRAEEHPAIQGFIAKPFTWKQFQEVIQPVLEGV